MFDAAKNWANKKKMEASKLIYPPPEADQFEENGQLSPD